MKEKKIRIVVFAVSLILAGIVLIGAAYLFGGRPVFAVGSYGIITWTDAKKEESEKFKTYTLEKTKLESFENIQITNDFANVYIEEGDDYYLEYSFYNSRSEPFYEVKEDTMTFEMKRDIWSEEGLNFDLINMGINGMHGIGVFSSGENIDKENYIKLYLPKNFNMENVDIKSGNGEFSWKNDGTVKSMKVKNEFGDTTVENITCKDMEISSSNGTMKLNRIRAGGKLSVAMNFGDVFLENVESKELELKHSNGDIKIGQIETESLNLDSDFGSITLKDSRCGKTELRRSNGELLIAGSDFEDFRTYGNFGNIYVEDSDFSNAELENSNGEISVERSDFNNLSIENDFGEIILNLMGREEDYFYQLQNDFGDIRLNGEKYEDKFKQNDHAEKTISVDNTNGSIEIETK